MYSKPIKNEKELSINRMVWTDKNTTKIHFYLNFQHAKYNDKTKQADERFQLIEKTKTELNFDKDK